MNRHFARLDSNVAIAPLQKQMQQLGQLHTASEPRDIVLGGVISYHEVATHCNAAFFNDLEHLFHPLQRTLSDINPDTSRNGRTCVNGERCQNHWHG